MPKIHELTETTTLATADVIPVMTDPAGTPVAKKITKANFKTTLTLVKADVGLGSVDNTADTAKPVSTAQQTALDLKGNVTSQTFVTPALGVATATSINKVAITAPATNATLTLAEGSTLTVSASATVSNGTHSGTNTGDQTLPVKAIGSEVDTGTDDAKFLTPKAIEDSLYIKAAYADAKVADAINDATTTIAPSQNAVFDALALKAPLASPTFTGTVTLPDATVALAKMADMATSSLIYRKTAATGVPEVNTLATLKTDLGLTGTNSGDQTVSDATISTTDITTNDASTSKHGFLQKLPGGTTTFLRADGSFAAPSGGSDPWTYAFVNGGSDFTTSSATAVDATGLAFTPALNTKYEFEAVLMLRTATTTVNPRVGLAWPTGMTDGVAQIIVSQAATGTPLFAHGNINAALLTAVGGLPNTTQSWPSTIKGTVWAGASPSGTVKVRLATETAATNVTIKAGSFIRYRTIA